MKNEKIGTKERLVVERAFVGQSIQCRLDTKGRIIIPRHLLSWGKLLDIDDAVVVGCGEYFEIWNEKEYEKEACENEN